MLTLVTRESVNGVSEIGGMVLNTSCISKLQTYSTTKARFKFHFKPETKSGGFDTYIVTESRATVKADMDRSFNAVTLQLNVYPDNDSTETVIATVFNAEDIIKAYPNTRTDRTKCWVEVNERGFKPRKYLVAHYYVDIYALARYGTTTTTSTTSTSSTSTTTTSTTSTTSTSTTSTSTTTTTTTT